MRDPCVFDFSDRCNHADYEGYCPAERQRNCPYYKSLKKSHDLARLRKCMETKAEMTRQINMLMAEIEETQNAQ
jgi:hypothetical protein